MWMIIHEEEYDFTCLFTRVRRALEALGPVPLGKKDRKPAVGDAGGAFSLTQKTL